MRRTRVKRTAPAERSITEQEIKERDTQAVGTIMSMCYDFGFDGGITREAFIRNLRMYADSMEKTPKLKFPVKEKRSR